MLQEPGFKTYKRPIRRSLKKDKMIVSQFKCYIIKKNSAQTVSEFPEDTAFNFPTDLDPDFVTVLTGTYCVRASL